MHVNLAEKGETSVTMEGSSDKRCKKNTPIFGISLNTNFLPTQLIYFMLRRQSRTFHILNANLALYSNSTESIKLIDEFIAPYISDI